MGSNNKKKNPDHLRIEKINNDSQKFPSLHCQCIMKFFFLFFLFEFLIDSQKGWPKQKKNRTHIFLSEIHKFNSSLFFFSGYEVDSVHEKLGP